jgi:hypothetical protein
MFKNRSFLVKVVKDQELEKPAELAPTNPPEDVIIEVVKEGSKYAAGLIGIYMAADTLRKIAIHTAATHIN